MGFNNFDRYLFFVNDMRETLLINLQFKKKRSSDVTQISSSTFSGAPRNKKQKNRREILQHILQIPNEIFKDANKYSFFLHFVYAIYSYYYDILY